MYTEDCTIVFKRIVRDTRPEGSGYELRFFKDQLFKKDDVLIPLSGLSKNGALKIVSVSRRDGKDSYYAVPVDDSFIEPKVADVYINQQNLKT